MFLKLDALGLLSAAVVGWLAFLTLLMAERIGMFWKTRSVIQGLPCPSTGSVG